MDNACGTIAVIHSLLNNRNLLGLTGSSKPLEKYFEKVKGEIPFKERGVILDGDAEISAIHNALVTQGQSQPVSGDKICHHFVSFVSHENHLVELDGAYNDGPNVVEELKGEFLEGAVEFIKKKYMEQIGSIQFSMMALVKKQ